MKAQDLRIVYMGTPEFAAGILDALVKSNHQIVGVVTMPDKPSGRGQKINKSAVKTYAESLSVPILQPEKLKDETFIASLKALNADLFIVVAFRMLPEVVWAMPPKGTINLHASLLPQYRGAAPINWAIINGETKTGVTTFFIEKEIDTGYILGREETEITENMTAGELHDELLEIGKRLVLFSVEKIATENFEKISQADLTIEPLKPAPKIFKEDGLINWNQEAEKAHNFIRGLSPYPAAWTYFHFEEQQQTKTVKIIRTERTNEPTNGEYGKIILSKNELLIGCSDYFLRILALKPEGKREMDAKSFVVGHQNLTISVAK